MLENFIGRTAIDTLSDAVKDGPEMDQGRILDIKLTERFKVKCFSRSMGEHMRRHLEICES